MQRSLGTLRDLKVAIISAAVLELLLIALSFVLGSELVGRHFWLELLQMPGAQIAVHLFRYAGFPQALACTVLIQWVVFGAIILGVKYACRLMRSPRQHSSERS